MYIIFLDEITLGLYLTFVAKKIVNFLSNNVECMVSGIVIIHQSFEKSCGYSI